MSWWRVVVERLGQERLVVEVCGGGERWWRLELEVVVEASVVGGLSWV